MLGLLSALAAVTGVVVCAGTIVVTRHRAEAAADLAALVVAGRVFEGEQAACAAGRATAQASGAQVLSCVVEDDLDAVVRVAFRPPGRLAGLGPVHAVARAGWRAPTPGG
jgi:secretion/DNA translocation related TadE-like protein